ncbi:hypothetical protein chiPu_0016238 [Chiloscyllium punctatum]|uniref:EGF-like domain-containing protein n=1 Tax=Chiloscyllium punctatum TaxID=137246 RepID=A0A401T533_CHIPU|nr:hypothetical protein [Chiloscyllium punctatum]
MALDIIHVLFDPSKTYPGGYLFQVTIGVKFEGDNFQEFEGIEKRVARSIENLIKHQLSTFSPSLKKLLLRSIERINAPVLFLTYWLYFNPGGQDIYGPLEIQLNQLKAKHVANLRHGKATLFFKSIEDVNECSSGLSMCDPRADCFNAFGFYSCRCIEGFEDRSLNGSGIECIANEKSGGSTHSLRHFHVKHLDHNTPLELELLSPSFQRFQRMDTIFHQTHTMELQLIIPNHADISSVVNSSVMTTGKEFLNYAVDWQMSSLWRTSPTLDAAQWAVDAATNPIDKTSLLDATHPVEPSMSQNPTWTTLAPKLHDIGSLLAISAGMELINVVYKNLQHLEKKVLQSVKALIMDSLASFSPPLKKILFQGVRRINSSGLAIDYQLYFGLNGENISHSLQIHLNKFLNKSMVNLRNGRIYLSWVLVGDVDECQSETAACSKEAKCLNTVGSYFCQCEDGFEDRSMGHSHICIDPLELDPSFWLSFGLQEILIGSAICTFLLSAVILILCFVIYKRSQNKYFRACDINLGGVAVRAPMSSADELESEESLVIIPHRISSYISFTKFQPIPEEPNGHEIDPDSELSNPYEMKPQPTFRTFHL